MESATVGGGGRDMAPESTQHGRGETQPGDSLPGIAPRVWCQRGRRSFLPVSPPGPPPPRSPGPTEGLPTPPTCLAPVQPHLCTSFDSVLLHTRLWVILSPGAQAVAGGGGGGRLHLLLWSPRMESWHAPTTPVPRLGGGGQPGLRPSPSRPLSRSCHQDGSTIHSPRFPWAEGTPGRHEESTAGGGHFLRGVRWWQEAAC